MKRLYLLSVVVIIILFAAFFAISLLPPFSRERGGSARDIDVCIRDSCFSVELALTPEQRALGLMHRESMDVGSGMLFVYDQEAIYSFWMKNTLITLDIIWINEDNEIVFISKNTQPCQSDSCPTINPGKEAMYVLEINGGLSERLGFAEGDEVGISLF